MITSQDIKNFVEINPKLVRKKETSIPGVYVLKYNNKCFYDSIWNKYIINCRGHVVDDDYNLIINPFTKIFNFGIEKDAPSINDDEYVFVSRKVNGFLFNVSWDKVRNQPIFGTTGSIDSKYVEYGKDLFYEYEVDDFLNDVKESNCTFMFEAVHPDDPHIIPEDSGLYYIGSRENTWNSPIQLPIIHNYPFGYAEAFGIQMCALKEKLKTCKHEGYVIYAGDGRVTKIKSPYYLIKKFFARCNNTQKLLERNVEKRYPEEYYPLINHIQSNVEEFTCLSEQDRLIYIRNYLENIL